MPSYSIPYQVDVGSLHSKTDGAVGTPSITFENDSTSGLYLHGLNQLGITVSGGIGNPEMLITPGFVQVTGDFHVTGNTQHHNVSNVYYNDNAIVLLDLNGGAEGTPNIVRAEDGGIVLRKGPNGSLPDYKHETNAHIVWNSDPEGAASGGYVGASEHTDLTSGVRDGAWTPHPNLHVDGLTTLDEARVVTDDGPFHVTGSEGIHLVSNHDSTRTVTSHGLASSDAVSIGCAHASGSLQLHTAGGNMNLNANAGSLSMTCDGTGNLFHGDQGQIINMVTGSGAKTLNLGSNSCQHNVLTGTGGYTVTADNGKVNLQCLAGGSTDTDSINLNAGDGGLTQNVAASKAHTVSVGGTSVTSIDGAGCHIVGTHLFMDNVQPALTAGVGNTYADHVAMTGSIVNLSVVGSAGDSVKLPELSADKVGMMVKVKNSAGNNASVWAHTGQSVEGNTAPAAAHSLTAGRSASYLATSATSWLAFG